MWSQGGGGDSGALVFTTYVHSSALTIPLYLHLWATFTCACVCAYVLPCACVTWRPSALATASGFDLQSDTYRRNTNKQTNDGPDFTSQLEHFHKIGRKKGKRGHIWIWSTDTKVTSPSKIPQIEKRIFKVAVLFMSSGEMSARCGFLGLLLARVRARGGWNGQTDRQRRREGRKRECEGGRYVTLAKPLSETRIYLATARWWSGVQEAAYTSVRPPTRFDSWNELSCPCYIYRQTGGMSCYRG